MSIRDDGIGMDQKVIELGGRDGHFGLAGMRERAERIKAEFTLSSRARTGTEIVISVPAALAYAKRPARRWQPWHYAFVK
jgi:signal transduction histidine kinase